MASNDLSGLFSDDGDDDEGDDSNEGSDSTEEPDSSPTPSSEPDIFSHGPDETNAPATSSDPTPVDIFTPERDLAASGSDTTNPETDSEASVTDESKPGAGEPSSEYDFWLPESGSTTTADSSSVPDFSDSFQSPTDPALSPLPDFTIPSETSPAPEPALAFSGSESLPESTPPPDASSPDTQLAMDTFLSPEPGIASTLPDSFSNADTSSASGGDSSLLPERNSALDGQLPPLGEGSNFDYTEFLPSETMMASASNDQADQNLLSLNSDEPSIILGRAQKLPHDFDDLLGPPKGDISLFPENADPNKPVPLAFTTPHDLYSAQNRDGSDSNLAQGYGGIGVNGFEGFWT